MQKYVLYRKELEILSITKDCLRKGELSQSFAASIDELFFENSNNLRPEFLELIPVSELEKTKLLLLFLRTIYMSSYDGLHSQRGGTRKREQVIEEIIHLESLLTEQMNQRFNYSVFYSWQSDTLSQYNRSFIEKCLSHAIDIINAKKTNGPLLSIDKDTSGIAGSPDIINTILNKIDHSVCFVADVTPIAHIGEKYVSNPNVMFELGYALSTLDYERIIIICNEAYCKLRDLPFDLGLKRIIHYKLDPESETKKDDCKKNLTSHLIEAISSIISI